MRKKEETRTGGKSKMTVMMFQLEGDDATLQEGFRTIGQAITTLLKPANVLPPPASNGTAALPSADNHEPAEPEEVAEEQEIEAIEERVSRQPRTYKTPEIIKDLDLTSGETSLKDFLTQKGVGDNDSKRCLAIAVWLKEKRGITDITADHIYTCYRHMSWGTPNDITGPLRGLKAQGCFSKGAAPKSYAINHIGENRVLEMGQAS